MADYIDREKLLDELGESASYHAESGREYQLLLRDRNIVREQPTADVIERSKIHKAIEEIEKIDLIVHDGINHYYKDGEEVIAEVLQILKRNIGE